MVLAPPGARYSKALMDHRPRPGSVSIYFFAGNFAEVLRRHAEGLPQAYGTHDEVARLVQDLRKEGLSVVVNSFLTASKHVEEPSEGVTVRSLGARNYADDAMLGRAVAEDDAEALIAHFPNLRLLKAVTGTGKASAAFLATSFYRRGLRSWLRTRGTVAALNHPQFDFVSNHCRPATEHLADLGVKRSKLIPWDVPHPYSPADSKPKSSAPNDKIRVFYAGSISEEKGVGDVVRAVAHLAEPGRFTFEFAGNGQIDQMRDLASSLGVQRHVTFLGSIPNPEVFERFKGADLLVVPSRWEFQEGFPLTMFEAIASRTPIVCSDHPIFARVLIDGEDAGLFRARDARSCARAIENIVSNPELYLQLSNQAEATWAKLQGPADWRSLILRWATEGPQSDWIRHRMLAARV